MQDFQDFVQLLFYLRQLYDRWWDYSDLPVGYCSHSQWLPAAAWLQSIWPHSPKRNDDWAVGGHFQRWDLPGLAWRSFGKGDDRLSFMAISSSLCTDYNRKSRVEEQAKSLKPLAGCHPNTDQRTSTMPRVHIPCFTTASVDRNRHIHGGRRASNSRAHSRSGARIRMASNRARIQRRATRNETNLEAASMTRRETPETLRFLWLYWAPKVWLSSGRAYDSRQGCQLSIGKKLFMWKSKCFHLSLQYLSWVLFEIQYVKQIWYKINTQHWNRQLK